MLTFAQCPLQEDQNLEEKENQEWIILCNLPNTRPCLSTWCLGIRPANSLGISAGLYNRFLYVIEGQVMDIWNELCLGSPHTCAPTGERHLPPCVRSCSHNSPPSDYFWEHKVANLLLLGHNQECHTQCISCQLSLRTRTSENLPLQEETQGLYLTLPTRTYCIAQRTIPNRIWKRIPTYITESLHCTPKTNTTL